MDPVPALGAIVTATAMAIFAGDIPAAMLRMPGTPASAAYTDESYLMGKKGLLDLNLGTNLVTSVLGGLIGVAILVLAAPALAEFALAFSSFEYFLACALGLTCAVFLATNDPLKGFASLFLGLGIGTVGIDPAAGFPRFTFGSVELMQGISFIPAMIGMFAISETAARRHQHAGHDRGDHPAGRQCVQGHGAVLRRYWVNFLRGSASASSSGRCLARGPTSPRDFLCGVKALLEGTREVRHRHVEGIVDAGAANNSALAAAWIPALVFGIPGDVHHGHRHRRALHEGMNPGPDGVPAEPAADLRGLHDLRPRQPADASLGWAIIKSAKQVLKVPKNILLPMTVIFCVVGLLRHDQLVLRHHHHADHRGSSLSCWRRTASPWRQSSSAWCWARCLNRTSSPR